MLEIEKRIQNIEQEEIIFELIETRKVQNSGNSKAMTIPQEIVKRMGLTKGEIMKIQYIEVKDNSEIKKFFYIEKN